MSSTLDQWYVSGLFGIGTLSPQARLHVAGGTWDPSNSEGDLKVGDATYRLKVGVATGGGGAGDVRIRAHGGTNRLMLGSGTLDTLFVVGDRIGVGVTAPPEKLSVHGGNVQIRQFPANDTTPSLTSLQLQNRSTGGGTQQWNLYTAAVGGGWGVTPNAFEIWEYPATKSRLQIHAGGNTALAPMGGFVGIGTTAPTHVLHVRTTDAVGLFESTGSQAYLRISANDGIENRVEITNRGGGRLSLWTAGYGDALNILRNGTVGIGTHQPQARLHVAGGAIIGGIAIGGDAPGVDYPYEYETVGVSNPAFNLRLQSPNSILLHLRDGATIDTTPHFASILRCADFKIGHPGRRGSPGRAIVDEGWRLVINYAKDWPYVRVEGNFSYGSSRVHKEDISELSADSASAVLRGLTPVRFRFKNDPTGRTCLGFVAEDVPDAVGSGDGTGIEPAGLLAILVKTVQEQAREIEAMTGRLDSMEGGG